jgi:hypothetical protein
MELSIQEATAKAFSLAYFIHRRREPAFAVTCDALAGLDAHLKPQRKRAYYNLRGRKLGGVDVRARTKTSVGDSQKLQLLVYLKSEEVEKLQECGDWSPLLSHPTAIPQTTRVSQIAQRESGDQLPHSKLTDEDWLIRFVKHVIAITTTRSSFYVTLGTARVIFNYATEEAVKLYDLIIQDSDRMKDAPYFRKRKNDVLMKGLKERFGDSLQTCVVAHGEERFKCRIDGEKFAPLVKQCLEMFTPWNTDCILPEKWNPMNDPINELCFKDEDPEKEHPVESRRMHTLIHPSCFERLTAALELTSPNERLEVPMFFFNRYKTKGGSDRFGDSGNQQSGSSGSERRSPESLTDEELAQIQSVLGRQRKRRRRAHPETVSVMINGVEREKIKANQKPVIIRIEESARLIEIKSHDDEGGLLLGSLLLDQHEVLSATPSREYRLDLGRRQQLLVMFNPIRDAEGEFSGADVTVAFRRTQSLFSLKYFAEEISGHKRIVFEKPAWVFVCVAVLLIATAAGVWYRRRARMADYIAQMQSQPSPPPSSVRGKESNHLPESATPQQSGQMPVARMTPAPEVESKSKTKLGSSQEGTRSLAGDAAAELAAVRRVYVEEHNGGANTSVRDAFIRTIAASGRLQTTGEANADAFLIWQVKRVGSTERIETSLLGRSGKKLSSSSRSVRAGESDSDVAAKLVKDLLAKITR